MSGWLGALSGHLSPPWVVRCQHRPRPVSGTSVMSRGHWHRLVDHEPLPRQRVLS